jgi:hypothetical protein
VSHKSGHIIINAMVPEDSNPPLACLNEEQKNKLNEIRTRDEYSVQDRIYLGMLVASIADDPAE